MDYFAGGRFRATLHRVVNKSGSGRYSIPFFYEPNMEAILEPLIPASDPRKHEMVDYMKKEFGKEKITPADLFFERLQKVNNKTFDPWSRSVNKILDQGLCTNRYQDSCNYKFLDQIVDSWTNSLIKILVQILDQDQCKKSLIKIIVQITWSRSVYKILDQDFYNVLDQNLFTMFWIMICLQYPWSRSVFMNHCDTC